MSQTIGFAVIAVSILALALLGVAAMYYVPIALREEGHDVDDHDAGRGRRPA